VLAVPASVCSRWSLRSTPIERSFPLGDVGLSSVSPKKSGPRNLPLVFGKPESSDAALADRVLVGRAVGMQFNLAPFPFPGNVATKQPPFFWPRGMQDRLAPAFPPLYFRLLVGKRWSVPVPWGLGLSFVLRWAGSRRAGASNARLVIRTESNVVQGCLIIDPPRRSRRVYIPFWEKRLVG